MIFTEPRKSLSEHPGRIVKNDGGKTGTNARTPTGAGALEQIFVVTAKDANQGGHGVMLDNLTCVRIDLLAGEISKVRDGNVFRICQESARIAPEPTAAGEPRGNSLLTLFVQILAQVPGSVHVPGDEVFPVAMKYQMIGAVRLGYMMPAISQLILKAGHVMREA